MHTHRDDHSRVLDIIDNVDRTQVWFEAFLACAQSIIEQKLTSSRATSRTMSSSQHFSRERKTIHLNSAVKA